MKARESRSHCSNEAPVNRRGPRHMCKRPALPDTVWREPKEQRDQKVASVRLGLEVDYLALAGSLKDLLLNMASSVALFDIANVFTPAQCPGRGHGNLVLIIVQPSFPHTHTVCLTCVSCWSR